MFNSTSQGDTASMVLEEGNKRRILKVKIFLSLQKELEQER
jgi:hypothetical protein